MRILVALLPLALPVMTALPAQAQSARTFSLPAGCTGYLTVQMLGCSVSHHFTCEGDPAGWQRRVDLDEEGISYYGAIDAETQWMESFHPYTGHSERLEPAPADPASFTELMDTGADSYDFQTLSDEIGVSHYVGQDKLTGEVVVIDGVTLEQTQFNITAYDAGGTMMWQSQGREFISRDWRMFLSGKSTVSTGEEQFDSDNTPVEFIFPGEPGFLADKPLFGCGAIMSSLTADPVIMPASLALQP